MKTIHINPQSKGSLGKSFETETRVSFLDAIGVAWHGYDLDDRHSTFRDRHPNRVELFSLEGGAKDAILRLMARALDRPEAVILVDCRAQADLLIREAFDSLGIFQRARGQVAGLSFPFSPAMTTKACGILLKSRGGVQGGPISSLCGIPRRQGLIFSTVHPCGRA